MAHIERRGPKRWKARYRGPDGKEHSQTFKWKVDAENWLTGVEGDKLRQAWIDPSLARTSLGDWTARWWETTATLKPKTRSGYEGLLRTLILPRFGASALSLIRPVDVQEWVAQLVARGLSPSRTRQAYYLLGAIMKAAVESGYLVKPPTVGVKLPRVVNREMRFLTAQQVNALAQAMPEPYPTLVYVLAYGGIRWGEMAALRRSRCDLLRSRIRIVESLSDVDGRLHFGPTKTYAARAVALPTFLRTRLAEHLASHVADDPSALVFTAPNGSPLRNSSFHKRFWTPAVRAAGLEALRPHDLRAHRRGAFDCPGRSSQGDAIPPRPLVHHRDPGPLRAFVSRRYGAPRGGPRGDLSRSPCGLTAASPRPGGRGAPPSN